MREEVRNKARLGHILEAIDVLLTNKNLRPFTGYYNHFRQAFTFCHKLMRLFFLSI